MEDLICFIGQKAFIEKDGELLILHNPQMGLDLPGGKVMENETDLSAALKREVKEETNLSIEVERPFFTWFFTIPLNSEHRSAGKKIFSVGYKCTYISGEIKLSSEHDWHKWVSKNNYSEFLRPEVSGFSDALKTYFEKLDN